jgi:hypothetical protein
VLPAQPVDLQWLAAELRPRGKEAHRLAGHAIEQQWPQRQAVAEHAGKALPARGGQRHDDAIERKPQGPLQRRQPPQTAADVGQGQLAQRPGCQGEGCKPQQESEEAGAFHEVPSWRAIH